MNAACARMKLHRLGVRVQAGRAAWKIADLQDSAHAGARFIEENGDMRCAGPGLRARQPQRRQQHHRLR